MSRPAAISESAMPGRALRPEPVGDRAPDDADPDDDRGEHEEDRARAVEAELARVQRDERVEARETETVTASTRPGASAAGWTSREWRGASAAAAARSREARARRARPRDRQAAASSQTASYRSSPRTSRRGEARGRARPRHRAIEADRLAAPLLGREVVDDRREADERHRLADAGRESEAVRAGSESATVYAAIAAPAGPPGDDEEPPSAPVPESGRRSAGRGEPSGSPPRPRARCRSSRRRAGPSRRREAIGSSIPIERKIPSSPRPRGRTELREDADRGTVGYKQSRPRRERAHALPANTRRCQATLPGSPRGCPVGCHRPARPRRLAIVSQGEAGSCSSWSLVDVAPRSRSRARAERRPLARRARGRLRRTTGCPRPARA